LSSRNVIKTKSIRNDGGTSSKPESIPDWRDKKTYKIYTKRTWRRRRRRRRRRKGRRGRRGRRSKRRRRRPIRAEKLEKITTGNRLTTNEPKSAAESPVN